MTDKHIQKAGEGSNQIQAQNIIINQGISEERVIAIVDERCGLAIQNCITESRLIAEQRVSDLKAELLSAFAKRPELVNVLNEPSCVDTLEKAAKVAAKTSGLEDKKLLSELLIKRFENPSDKHIASGVTKAIEIVDLLTDDELLGLTTFYAIHQYTPISRDAYEGLSVLDGLFGKLGVDNLPLGDEWIDNLDIHNALRVSQFIMLKPLADLYFDSLSGYTQRGIEIGSPEEAEATKIIAKNHIPQDVLKIHELNPGYLRLNVRDINNFDELAIVQTKPSGEVLPIPFNDEQRSAMQEIALMCKGAEKNEIIKENLEKAISSLTNLSEIEKWWNQIPSAPAITIVGKTLANANARRIDPSLPDLN